MPISQLQANSYDFYFDYQNSKYGWNTDSARGADTFHPFSSGGGFSGKVSCTSGANSTGSTSVVYSFTMDGTFKMTNITRSAGGGSQDLNLGGSWKLVKNNTTIFNKTSRTRGACPTYSNQTTTVASGDKITLTLGATGDVGDNGSSYSSTSSCTISFTQ